MLAALCTELLTLLLEKDHTWRIGNNLKNNLTETMNILICGPEGPYKESVTYQHSSIVFPIHLSVIIDGEFLKISHNHVNRITSMMSFELSDPKTTPEHIANKIWNYVSYQNSTRIEVLRHLGPKT